MLAFGSGDSGRIGPHVLRFRAVARDDGGRAFRRYRRSRDRAARRADLDAAAQMIELLAMLQEKTKGNLIEQEERLLDDLLYELRLRFVQAQQDDKRIIEP